MKTTALMRAPSCCGSRLQVARRYASFKWQKVWANALAAQMDENQLRAASAVLAQQPPGE
ncbi:MAG: hypothetical protein ABIR76_00150 [Polaromonas sp.]